MLPGDAGSMIGQTTLSGWCWPSFLRWPPKISTPARNTRPGGLHPTPADLWVTAAFTSIEFRRGTMKNYSRQRLVTRYLLSIIW